MFDFVHCAPATRQEVGHCWWLQILPTSGSTMAAHVGTKGMHAVLCMQAGCEMILR